MAGPTIVVTNVSTVLSDSDVSAAVPALQTQVSRDFAPIWGIDATIAFVPKDQPMPSGSWWLVVLDNSDQAGALGYHDLTHEGLPLGKVFAGTDQLYHQQWTVTASHELLEMLGDPYINLTALIQTGTHRGRMFAYEVCDACEADQYSYEIGGIQVSDFVYPAWFEPATSPHGITYDKQGFIGAPQELLAGGYIGVFDIRSGSGWTQLTAEAAPIAYAARPHVGSRRERRRTPFDQWQRSAPKVLAGV